MYSAPADTNDLNNAIYDKNEDERPPDFSLDYLPNNTNDLIFEKT